MKKDRRCESCHAQVPPRTTSWIIIHRTTREFVASDWSRNSASRSYSSSQQSEPASPRGSVGTHPLEDLLSADILQSRVQVLDPRLNVLKLVLISAFDDARLANGHVQGQLDATVDVGGAQPASLATVGRGGEADLVVAGLVGGEGEAAAGAALLRYYAVVVVEELLFAMS